MKEYLASFINPIGDFLLEIFLQIPMGVVFLIFMGLFALLAIWVISLPKQIPETAGRKGIKFLQDLRIAAIVILSLQALLYVLFY